MSLFGGPKPPPPPPPPANPPSYGSQGAQGPVMTSNPFLGGIGSSILTSPQGAPDARAVQRKTLLGQ